MLTIQAPQFLTLLIQVIRVTEIKISSFTNTKKVHFLVLENLHIPISMVMPSLIIKE